MIISDRVIGVLAIEESHRNHAFPESTIDLLMTLASSTTGALENVRLFNETRRLLTETEERAAELAVINTVQHALAAEVDTQGIVDIVGDKIREIFGAQTGFIALIDRASNLVHFPYDFINDRRVDGEPLPRSKPAIPLR